ncbi:hypothetical protein BpHYR1_041931 [Brachionus plicatilis]|uniref:Uncharacterized protein n=1 Tax=Brachionus plicatilis TaxID=10195 RepID=A0A3M7QPA4_BRAPC|nr:hypothetical protein BpHYR1_041931 [Brachionus plicatilis]
MFLTKLISENKNKSILVTVLYLEILVKVIIIIISLHTIITFQNIPQTQKLIFKVFKVAFVPKT